ncbi:MAG: hypothetical protein ACRC8C_01670 [Mycoplasmoidaceae bacterium]
MNKKIKLGLLGVLITGSALSITLPIISCSSANEHLLTVIFAQGQTQGTLEVAATAYLQTLIDLKNTEKEKIDLIKTWKRDTIIDAKLRDEIFKIIHFNDISAIQIPEVEAVEKVIFASDIVLPEGPFSSVEGPTIRIILKKDYTTTSPIDIKIHKLSLDPPVPPLA